ncbi:MAG: glycoside hydrolase family 9 protein [Bacteroidia bacterium]
MPAEDGMMKTGKIIFTIITLTAIAGWIIWLFAFHKTQTESPYSSDIRLNQVGFYPGGPKTAIIRNAPSGEFTIRRLSDHSVVFSDTMTESLRWSFSGEVVRKADFSAFDQVGRYYLEVPLVGNSYPFLIETNIHQHVLATILRSFYFQRSSQAIVAPFAEKWPRKAGHADDQVKIHPSAASASRPAGTLVSAPGGWYDAGDYGKYVPTATFATWMLLGMYETAPEQYDTFGLNIPESGNTLPDILDESLWSIRWLLTMQDPGEGFVCHKLTTSRHPGKIMPEDDRATRLMIGKSTAATLGFAAVMAQASRIIRKWEPGLADSCLKASLAAWRWGRANPAVSFENPRDIETGPCLDYYFEDERAWAAAELWVTTREDSFYYVGKFGEQTFDDAPTRRNVGPLAWMSLLAQPVRLPVNGDEKIILRKLRLITDRFRDHALTVSPYGVPVGDRENDFLWGSNGNLASRGVLLMFMARKTGDASYAAAATAALDYILGRNATGYCFITGVGSYSPMDIHHRISLTDGVFEPVPGLMAGGPQNELNRDGCVYPDSLPATTYLDSFCSYTTNEVTINWNAPLARLCGEIERWYTSHAPVEAH